MTDNMIAKIREHYEHAKSKHPYFCDTLIPKSTSHEELVEETKNLLEESRELLKSEIAESDVFCMDVLWCEIAEVASALAENDTAHAVEECYDAIAVLLRVVDVLEGRQALGRPEEVKSTTNTRCRL